MIAPQTVDIQSEIAAAFPDGLTLKAAVPARTLTTFGIGGAARLVIDVRSVEALQRLLPWLIKRGLPWKTLGAGSNVIFGDAGIDVPLIRLGREFSGFERRGEAIFVHGATPLMSLSRELSQAGYTGLEFAAGIPASLGGAIVMNAGAHGHSISEVVRSALVLDERGTIRERSRDKLEYSYRHSSIGAQEIVLGATLVLEHGDAAAIKQKRNACLDYRRKTQPLHMPSSGSVFRNPSEGPAAAELLERSGLKGKRLGGVSYSEMHSNWLVRVDESGRAAEAEELIALGIETVGREHGVVLRPEIILWR